AAETATPTNTDTPEAQMTATHTYTYTHTPTATYTNTADPDATPTDTPVPGMTVDLMSVVDTSLEIGTETTETVVIETDRATTEVAVYMFTEDGSPVGSYTSVQARGDGVNTIEFSITDDTAGIDMSDLPSGNYYFTVTAKDGSVVGYSNESQSVALINSSVPTFTPTQTPTPDVTQTDELEVPEYFDEDGDGETGENERMRSYPNPAGPAEDMTFKFFITKDAQSVKIDIYSAASRLVRSVEIPGSFKAGIQDVPVSRLHFEGLSRGTYFYVIRVTDESGKTAASKIDKIVITR
ncbi:MAG: hypothetical protein ACLFP1_07740, partial [Candidatus Goldiibacteriota bacterium]